ncbi:sulfurtransferase [Ideonella sp. 4Y16]|uniref:Sulfurtransferase n=1 Tax=Ideonella alba TaxID=2824118 RepID=A0A940YKN1_9BURK|nr:rhodanese-like domain-containing protein [Ideonella alba]MBQ0931559.1 sulfurtransferase [Ideonella alba]MBQ0943865.1 sulfurtransferase [Ideonella alba]
MNAITVQQLHAFLADHADRQPLLLDVREAQELAIAPLNLAGVPTLHMPMHLVPLRRTELDPARPVVVFCHHGARSAQVVAYLSNHGFDEVYNLEGGTDAWSRLVDPSVPRY